MSNPHPTNPEEEKYRPTPKRIIEGKVRAIYQMIYDSKGNHICDIRGWGRLQYYKEGDKIQDKLAQWVADAINEKLGKDPI